MGCPTDYVIVIYELEKGDVVIEFEAEDDHSFNFVVLKMGGGHAHHHHGHDEDHSDEEHADEHGDEHGDTHGDEHGDHDDHWEPNTCHDEDTHETHDEYTNKEDCEAAGHMWMEDNHSEEEMTVEGLLYGGDANNDSHISWEEFSELMENDDHDHQDGDHHDGHHDDNESNDSMNEAMENYMMSLLQDAFNESDMYYYNGGNNDAGDGLLNSSELEIFIEKFDIGDQVIILLEILIYSMLNICIYKKNNP